MKQIEAFKYCLRCGAKAEPKNNHLACSACGLHFYLNPKPCTSVILQNEEGEYLFVNRAFEPRKDYWDFPGGFAEEGEDFEACSRREIKEELGISLDNLKYLSSHKDIYEHQGISYATIVVAYLGKLPASARIRTADDVDGYRFFSLNEVPMDRLAFPSMREMIENLKKRSK